MRDPFLPLVGEQMHNLEGGEVAGGDWLEGPSRSMGRLVNRFAGFLAAPVKRQAGPN